MPSARQTDSPQGVRFSRVRSGIVDPDQAIIITIDGPAGTGKSTVARLLAARLGLDFLDTGAMYRAAAAIFLDRKLDKDQVGELVSAVIGADLHFDWSTDPPAMLAWDDPMDARIRDADVTETVSWVASISELRRHMVRKQRVIAAQHPRLVTEGRDQGSVAFPDAPVKFYLDADASIRATRRAEQLAACGQHVDHATMLERIRTRDELDSTRDDGPLICPDDAEVIDSSSMTVDEVIDRMVEIVGQRVGAIESFRPRAE